MSWLPQIQLFASPLLYIPGPRVDPFFNHAATLSAALLSGALETVVIDAPDQEEAASLSASLSSGSLAVVIIDAPTSTESATLSAALVGGSLS